MRRTLKWIGYGVGGLVGLIVVALACVYAVSELRFRKTYAVEPASIAVPNDSVAIARGAHIVNAVAKCVDCHGERLEGTVMIDQQPMGRLVALNLTPGMGGIGKELTPVDIERAVRRGVGRDGRSLRIMPSTDYQYMTDADVAAVAAYVKSLTPHDNALPESSLGVLPRVLMVAGAMPILAADAVDRTKSLAMTATPGPTKEYGAYLAIVGGCRGCHGENLSGGKIAAGDPAWPPAANLTPAGNLGKWTEAQFVETIRTGKRPGGAPLNDAMPWKSTGRMTDEEFHALWLYLQSVPPKEYGSR